MNIITDASVDAKLLYQELVKADVGGSISYKTLSLCVGRDVQDGARGALYTARKMAEREKNIVFGVIRGEGLKRLDDIEIVNTGESVRAHIRRTARKGARRILRVRDYVALPQEQKVQHNAYASLFGAISEMVSPSNIARIASAVEKAEKELPLKKTLELFG